MAKWNWLPNSMEYRSGFLWKNSCGVNLSLLGQKLIGVIDDILTTRENGLNRFFFNFIFLFAVDTPTIYFSENTPRTSNIQRKYLPKTPKCSLLRSVVPEILLVDLILFRRLLDQLYMCRVIMICLNIEHVFISVHICIYENDHISIITIQPYFGLCFTACDTRLSASNRLS